MPPQELKLDASSYLWTATDVCGALPAATRRRVCVFHVEPDVWVGSTCRGSSTGSCARLRARSRRSIRTPVLHHATGTWAPCISERCCLLRPGLLCPYRNLPVPARRVRLHDETHGNTSCRGVSDVHAVVVIVSM
jgi:hypothetical protein